MHEKVRIKHFSIEMIPLKKFAKINIKHFLNHLSGIELFAKKKIKHTVIPPTYGYHSQQLNSIWRVSYFSSTFGIFKNTDFLNFLFQTEIKMSFPAADENIVILTYTIKIGLLVF